MIPNDKLFKYHYILNGKPVVMDAVVIDKVYNCSLHRFSGYTYRPVSNRKNIPEHIIHPDVMNFVEQQEDNAAKVENVEDGSNVFITPNCPVPVDDIRKNYNVKRCAKDADYIITHEESIAFRNMYRHDIVFVFPEDNFAAIIMDREAEAFLNPDKVDARSSAKYPAHFSNYSVQTLAVDLGLSLHTIYKSVTGAHKTLVHSSVQNYSYLSFIEGGGLKDKKIIDIKKLKLGSNVPLTLDMVQVFRTAAEADYSKEAVEKYYNSLSALNQTNWRDYKGTLTRVIYKADKKSYCAARNVELSKMPKSARVIYEELRQSSYKFLNEADYNMYQELLCEESHIDDITFMTLEQLKNLCSIVPYGTEDSVFDIQVRIRPCTWERYQMKNNIAKTC